MPETSQKDIQNGLAGGISGIAPSRWEGQQNIPGYSYKIVFEFKRSAGRTTVSYFGADGKWHGPFDTALNPKTQQITFRDDANNVWALNPSMEGTTAQPSSGIQPTSQLHDVKPTELSLALSSWFNPPSSWEGQLNANGSYHIDLKFEVQSGTPTATYRVGNNPWAGPYSVTEDQDNREIYFDDGPQNPGRWTLRCGQNQALRGEKIVKAGEHLATQTARVELQRTQ